MARGSSAVTIGLLGPVAIDTGGGMVEIAGTRARRLLAALTLQPGIVRSASVLIDLVWSDAQPKSPQSALHTQISRLRHALPEGMIAAGSAGYRLDLTGHTVDVDRARNLIDDGTAGSLDDAARLWRGVPGDDLGDDDLAAEVRAVGDDLRRRLDERRCRVALASGDHETARRVAQSLCDHDPLDEPAHLLLMRALQAAGRPNDALAVHARLRRTLSSELGVDPGAEIEALHRALLAADAPVAPAEVLLPAPSRRGRAVGLRAEPNELLGRDTDIDEVLVALGQNRVVTITGPGGAGKTRMVHAVGRRLAAAARTLYVVELASVRNDADVVAAIAATLGVGESELTPSGQPRIPVGDLDDRLADTLAGRNAVLALDNCEQIIEGSARAVAELIAAVDDVTVLTTSRAPLMVAGEVIHRLAPLPTDVADSPAVELFVTRARSVRPDAVIDPAVVADLCRDLDGLPLAIELAAARVRTLSVPDIAQLLSEHLARGRLALLRTGDRTAPQRHRTLHAVIEWSWDLLDDDARRALVRLCRFPGGFTVAAAGEVVAGAGHHALVDDLLEQLVNQSLLTVTEVDGRIRYRMLEMVREFGEEQLVASGEADEVDAAMIRWAIGWAGDVRALYDGGEQAAAMARVIADNDNIVWILRRCTEIDPADRPADAVSAVVATFPVMTSSWVARGLHVEIRNWAPRILGLLGRPPRDLPDDVRELWQVALLMVAGHLVMIRPDIRLSARAMTALRAVYHPSEVMTRPADFASGILLSRSTFAGLRILARGARSPVVLVRAIALSVRSNARENVGDLDGALRDSLQAQSLAVYRGDLWITATGSMEIGNIHGQCARYAEAVESYRKAAALLAELGAVDEVTQVRIYLACSHVGVGEIDRARAIVADMSDGWTPDQPVPPGSTEAVGSLLMAHAEVSFAEGDVAGAGALAATVLHHVLGDSATASPDPSTLLVISSAVAMAASTGRTDVACERLPMLIEFVAAQFEPPGYRDIPQTGACAVAFATALAAHDPGSVAAARLHALGVRARARRDYPILNRSITTARARSGLSDEVVDGIDDEIGRMSRRRAAENILPTMRAALA
ncbi:BTAD domain-containing putative transcriptional regulator [Williamsia phyllosphaerae]|uniref:SARP family transcriptional regulator n=1 Tax=Williamsia phyllosphaerae TaxID=885042 RepID=A0ABQ1UQU9_9NOCA|nr:BTAD domain-containing putative transcriptional regulator [Williamsia phyllosphaerae]GGF22654.1 SARP family transcriptional regulator [Williamsia phyllosphaerae]